MQSGTKVLRAVHSSRTLLLLQIQQGGRERGGAGCVLLAEMSTISSPNDAGQWPEEVLGVWFPLSLLLGCPLGMSYNLLV